MSGQETEQLPTDDFHFGPSLLQLGFWLQNSRYTFITPTPVTHQRVNDRAGDTPGATLREAFGWNRWFHPGLLPPAHEKALLAHGVLEHPQGRLKSTVRWSTLNNLLLAHSAFPTVQADAVFFGPDTYRFAQSIERHLRSAQSVIKRAVDIGCGTGAGAMLIAQAYPQAKVIAADINPKALAFTRINAELAGLNNLICRTSNVLNELQGCFDLIVANPPYMKDSKQRAYRHGGDTLGADLSVRIVHESVERLSVGGSLVLYTGVAIVDGRDPFLAAVAQKLQDPSLVWRYRELDPDVFGEELLETGYEHVDRIAAVELIVTRRV
jgi:methylase of polypeptide subunit release factors